MAESVRIVFLGGLGEIGRNCMAIEQGDGDDRAIVLIDCGLMFPEARYAMVRAGLGIYGLRPAPDVAPALTLQPAMRVIS